MLNNTNLTIVGQTESKLTYQIYTDNKYLHIIIEYEKPFTEALQIPLDDAPIVMFILTQVMLSYLTKYTNKTDTIKQLIKELEEMI